MHCVSPFFHENEIWWCAIGVNIGTEEDGKNHCFERPVLVYRKFTKELFWGIPLTSKIKQGSFYFHLFIRGIERTAILNQMRIFSGKRLVRRISKLNDPQSRTLEIAFEAIIKRTPLRESSGA